MASTTVPTGVGRGRGLKQLRKLAATTVRQAHAEFPLCKVEDKNDANLSQDSNATEEEKPSLLNAIGDGNDAGIGEKIVRNTRLSEEDSRKHITDNKTVTQQNFVNQNVEQLDGTKPQEPDSSVSSENSLLNKNPYGISQEQKDNYKEQTSSLTTSESKKFDEVLLRSVNCKVFVPKRNIHISPLVLNSDDSSVGPHSPIVRSPLLLVPSQGEDSFILNLCKDTVDNLTFCPGDFDSVIDSFTETLSMFITKRETMEEVVSIIIEHAIAEPNFVYSAVRMAHAFDEKKTLEISTELSFRACLYPRLRKEALSIPILLKDKSEKSEKLTRATGLAMFFGELLCKMKKSSFLNVVFLKATFEIINDLVEDARDATISCLTNFLKLTGPTLDEHKITEHLTEVDTMFIRIRDLAMDNNWLETLERGKDLRDRLFRVFKLHTRNWDRGMGEEKPAIHSASSVEESSAVDWSEYVVDYQIEQEEPAESFDDYELFLRDSGQL